jgi:hypothetical protein
MTKSATIPNRSFFSYHRRDNAQFEDVVDRLKSDISNRLEAETGMTLEVFLDRDSIGWGNDWRNEIEQAVNAATLFIPIITMRYFSSEACKEELLAFHAAAKQRGVTDLILPIILFGTDEITAESHLSEVQLIERLNYISIEKDWEEGYSSPEWRRAIARIVTGLRSALLRAEEQLESSASGTSLVSTNADQHDPTADVTSFMELLNDVTTKVEVFGKASHAFISAFQVGFEDMQLNAMTPGQQNAFFLRLARDLKEPGLRVENAGIELANVTTDTDAQLRAVISELEGIDSTFTSGTAKELRSRVSELPAEFEGMDDQLGEINSILRTVALMNSSLRRSIQPVTRGFSSLNMAMATVRSWESI